VKNIILRIVLGIVSFISAWVPYILYRHNKWFQDETAECFLIFTAVIFFCGSFLAQAFIDN
jgi:hypothetical protein